MLPFLRSKVYQRFSYAFLRIAHAEKRPGLQARQRLVPRTRRAFTRPFLAGVA
jgi:hypothetical protein